MKIIKIILFTVMVMVINGAGVQFVNAQETLQIELDEAKKENEKLKNEIKKLKNQIARTNNNNKLTIAVPKPNPRRSRIATVDLNVEVENRPQTYTQELNDQRLDKLPSKQNTELSEDEVIAIRYHALVLINNNECSEVINGGRSRSRNGWLYVVCKDDPNYLRQFPLKKTTW